MDDFYHLRGCEISILEPNRKISRLEPQKRDYDDMLYNLEETCSKRRTRTQRDQLSRGARPKRLGRQIRAEKKRMVSRVCAETVRIKKIKGLRLRGEGRSKKSLV